MAKRIDRACPAQPPLAGRALLSPIQAGGLATVFKVLANDTRLRLLHALARGGEVAVSALAAMLGMKPQAVSNQLARLLDLGVVACRREGNGMLYRVIDPCVIGLLEQGWCLTETAAARSTLASRCCAEEP
ncbi:MAG: metalloregulator ArsR/SmtB family transcription factor [Gemmataceae bacterium]|nr:metalloregulator ArsR/SmtB family transcription factor [Gemmataceae bacterium]